MSELDHRLYFEDPSNSENSIGIFANARDGVLSISVAEEQAVDSYNDKGWCP